MTSQETRQKSPEPQEYYLPAVDALETKDELVLVADVPGVAPENLEVTVEQGVLTLIGRVAPSVVTGQDRLQQEFLRGDYYRQFRIPRDFVADRIDASLKAGVVTIRIPRQERSKPRKITVHVE